MASKAQVITMRKVKGKGKPVEFTLDHALGLLRMQASHGNKGWEIVGNEWTFENNEISRGSNTGSGKKSD